MKKNSFVEGAFISTFGIIITKVIGILYVIPFRAVVGLEGAILYSYAYTIYAVFASLSSTGIPSAMAKTISEYDSKEQFNAKQRAYKLTRNLLVVLGIVLFLILFIFAPQMAYLIIGDLEGGNSLEDISFVIRCISFALLFIPILSVCKGYLQGHRIMSGPAIANIIEQVGRVIIILAGSFLVLNVFDLSVTTAVGVAVFGAAVGALIAYLYLLKKIHKNKDSLNKISVLTAEERKITNKTILTKIIKYSLPFITIELIRSSFNTIDIFTMVGTLVDLGYDITDAENITSVLTTWGSKLNMIVLAISAGLTASIIPNVVRNAVLKNKEALEKNILQSLKIITFVTLPMILGLHFLADSVWTLFYGYDPLASSVFSFYVFQTITTSLAFVLSDTSSALNKSKLAILSLAFGFILKLVLNIPMMHLFHLVGLKAYYGSVVTTMITQAITTIFLLNVLKKTYDLKFKSLINPIFKIILINIIMMLVLNIVRLIIGQFAPTILSSIMEIIIYALIGLFVYGYLSIKNGLIKNVFGVGFVEKIQKKFKR